MRLIDADAMTKYIEEITADNEWLVNQYNADWIDIFIEGRPTVDAVEVVRCRECKHRSPSVTSVKNAVWCREFRSYMPTDGYCSYGERRE